jgi:hypothetical protein
MSKRIYEETKIDVALQPQAVNGQSGITYFPAAKYCKLLFMIVIGAMAAGATAILRLKEAKDDSGTSTQYLSNVKATITANSNVSSAQIIVGSPSNGDTVVINGITYTKAASTTVASKEFADAAGLVLCVNNATYGVPGVKASNNSGTITLVSTDPGEYTITITKTGSALTCSTLSAVAYLEKEMDDLSDDYTHLGAIVTTSASMNVGIVLLRAGARYLPDQKVAATAS